MQRGIYIDSFIFFSVF